MAELIIPIYVTDGGKGKIQSMRKVSEYEQHAAECREMAAKIANPIHRKQLEDMAEAWTVLARERQKQLAKRHGSAPASTGA